MDSAEKLATLGTQDTERRPTKQKQNTTKKTKEKINTDLTKNRGSTQQIMPKIFGTPPKR